MAAVRGTILLATLVALTAAKHAPPPPPPPVVAPAPPTIKSGVEKWRAGDYAAAVAIWTPFAAAGDADALFNLGQAYKLGRGVTADPVAARDYYRKAAVKGHLPAQANLGIALFQAGEKPEAIKWLKTAADRGEARAQYVLGIAAFNGDGIPRSQSLGYGYLLRAQASGLPQAVTALGGIAPGLSPADRTAGEAVAASLAAGAGVPPALAAATAPRLIASGPPTRTTLPIVTPPVATPAPSAPAGSAATPSAPATGKVAPPPTGPVTAMTTAPADKPVLPPVPKPAPAVPLREPTPAQADAQARVRDAAPDERAAGLVARPDATTSPPAIATVAIPASRPAPSTAVPAPRPASSDLLAPKPTRPASDPLAPKPTRTPIETARADTPRAETPRAETLRADATAAKPATSAAAPLKPVEVAAIPPAKKPDGWRVQLGAFSSRKLADAAWADVKDAAAPTKPIFATDGPVTKLQMGPFATRDAAKAACTKLTAAGRACFVTAG